MLSLIAVIRQQAGDERVGLRTGKAEIRVEFRVTDAHSWLQERFDETLDLDEKRSAEKGIKGLGCVQGVK